ncbi:MAG: hypothetical protein WDZ90_01460 [Candidatus Paceibacterota bacterium]
MEPKFRSSFIPKESLKDEGKGSKTRTAGMGIIMLVTLVLFLGTITLAAGVFFYQQFLFQSIESKKASFERAEEAFSPSLITELSRVDSRLTAAEDLLGRHVSVSALLELLEETTLRNVRFREFRYSSLSGPEISLSMDGEARSFNAVALQSDAFGGNRFINNSIFSNLNIDQRGNVVFNFSATVDPRLISYERLIEGREE